MAKNINCAAMGYDCVFSVTAEDDQQNFIMDVVEKHAYESHPELIEDMTLKPAIRSRLRSLLIQSKFMEQSGNTGTSSPKND